VQPCGQAVDLRDADARQYDEEPAPDEGRGMRIFPGLYCAACLVSWTAINCLQLRRYPLLLLRALRIIVLIMPRARALGRELALGTEMALMMRLLVTF
jgi:hypothetical protein